MQLELPCVSVPFILKILVIFFYIMASESYFFKAGWDRRGYIGQQHQAVCVHMWCVGVCAGVFVHARVCECAGKAPKAFDTQVFRG